MKEKLRHTPEGVRDIYHSECKRKKALELKLHDVLALYGYQDIETPAFEFFDVFNSDTGTVSSREMFKFFDRNNNTLVLRPDMTPSIARSAAKYYYDCRFPLRLSYVGDTFMNHHSYQGKPAQKTELGAEHINDDSPEADAEAVIMMIDCFLAAGLDEFRIDIGQTEFYRAVIDSLKVEDEIKARIHELIENKNSLGMELLLSGLDIEEEYRVILEEYNELDGDVAMLEKAAGLTANPRCRKALDRLKQVYDVICEYGYERYIGFDLGMVNYYDYYTGIIFRGYTYGTGDAIGKGGRYDNLLLQFGKDAPAIGFTILIDDLMMALSRQNISVSIKDFDYAVLLYKKADRRKAISLVSSLRDDGIRTELSVHDENGSLDSRLKFIKYQGARKAFVLEGDMVDIHDFVTDQRSRISLQEFREEY